MWYTRNNGDNMAELVKAASYKEQIYKIIKSKILNQEYGGNLTLNERTIAEELKVSRTPVREALKALEADDWVEYIPYKGIIVKRLGPRELEEIFQIRRALESLMIELVMSGPAARADEVLIQRLGYCLEEQERLLQAESGKYDLFLEQDAEFHSLLLHRNPNLSLVKLISNLNEKIRKLGLQSLYSGPDRFAQTVDEHRQILEALQAWDVKRAKTAMERHIDMVFQTASAYLESSNFWQD